MRPIFAVLAGVAAALPCLVATGASAADVSYGARPAAVRTLTVTRVNEQCLPLPTVVARGRRGMGEPGTFYAYWEWAPVCVDHVVFGR